MLPEPARLPEDAWTRVERARARLEAAVLPADVLRVLRHDVGLTQATVAAACGSTDRSVRQWERGGSIRRRNADRLFALADTVLVLCETLTLDGVEQWLWSRMRALQGRRPVELLADGEHEEVVAAARRFVEGTYV